MAITFGRSPITASVLTGLGRSVRASGTAFERLGSGLRINRAADDAAGLSVAASLDFRSRVLGRGRQNVADGISALSIVDATLESVGTIMDRLSELAESAASGSVSGAQRRILAKEYQALDREIRRITGATQFNGIKLLQGNASSVDTGFSLDTLINTNSSEALSSDGRYFTYRESSGSVKQYDRSTGVTTTIATGTAARTPVSNSNGDTVIYRFGNNLWKWDRASGTSIQLTQALTTETYTGLSISSDGGSVAFTALTRYVNGSGVSSATTSGAQRIYKLDLATGLIATVGTDITGTPSSFQLSPDGTRLVFISTQNPVGTNGDGNSEVFVADYSSTTPTYAQVTQTTAGSNSNARIADGGQVYFVTDQNVGGVNSGGASNIVRYDLGSGTYNRLTANSVTGLIGQFSVNDDGSLISYLAFSDQTGEGTHVGYGEVYRIDTVNGEIRQASRASELVKGFTGGIISRDGGTAWVNVGDGELLDTFGRLYDIGASARSFVVDAGNIGRSTISVGISDLMATLRGAGGFAISAQPGARAALDRLQANRDNLTALRGTVGAAMSRLNSANNIVYAHANEYAGARGTIMNADTAEDVATMVRSRILQETGAQLLSAAKLQPELALRLLRG